MQAPISSRTAVEAPVLEVFPSVQGEGLHVGEPQVLVRVLGCPFRCRWCDTPGALSVPAPRESLRVRRTDSAGGVFREEGWATPFRAATWVAAADPARRRTVSLTGGEPLAWPAFVCELRGFLGPRRLHLETAGGHPDELESVLEVVDHVSLDLKLPDDLDEPVPLAGEALPRTRGEWAEARARSLELVRGRDACGKIVVAGGRDPELFVPLLDDVALLAPELPVFLQPATPVGGVPAPRPVELLDLVELALQRRLTVRVVPQVHRLLRVP